MFNYAKANFELDTVVFGSITNFEATARQLATESLEHTTAKKALEETIANLVKDGKNAQNEQNELDALNEAWKKRNAEFNAKLFGGKDADGNKTNGICGLVTDDLYKAYVASITEGKTSAYKTAVKDFVTKIIVGDVKESALNHFINDIFMTMSSTKYNSNKNLADGCAFITTINKRTFKKMFLGTICDVVANNHTLKVAKPKKDNGKKNTK